MGSTLNSLAGGDYGERAPGIAGGHSSRLRRRTLRASLCRAALAGGFPGWPPGGAPRQRCRAVKSGASSRPWSGKAPGCFPAGGTSGSPAVLLLLLMTRAGSGGDGNGSPLQYPCLENPTDGGAWWAAVHGVPKSRTRLSERLRFPFSLSCIEEGNGNPLLLPGESQGRRSLVGCRLWGRTESDTTEAT